MIDLVLVTDVELRRTLRSISTVYKNILLKYSKNITQKSPQETSSKNGMYRTWGTHFEQTIGYNENHYGGGSTTYDSVIKVGGQHCNDFGKIKEKVLLEFSKKICNILEAKGFTIGNRGNKHVIHYEAMLESFEKINVFIYKDVSYGSNFSVYCGLRITVTGLNHETRVLNKSLRELLRAKGE